METITFLDSKQAVVPLPRMCCEGLLRKAVGRLPSVALSVPAHATNINSTPMLEIVEA